MTTHAHPDAWPFAVPPETEVATTRQVLEGAPVLLVNHGEDGRWLFHCASTEDLADKRQACFGCLASQHPDILALAGLPRGQPLSRDTAADAWPTIDTRSPKEMLEAAVAENGWQTVVFPPQRPLFGFTIGLTRTFGHPEAFIIGLPPQLMFQILENVAKAVAGGHRFEPGERTELLLEQLSCGLRPVDAAWHGVFLEPLSMFYGAEPLQVLQVVWPDRQGKLPGDDGFDPAFLARQPQLEHADAERAGMLPLLEAMDRGRQGRRT